MLNPPLPSPPLPPPSCSAPGLLVYQGTGHSFKLGNLTPNQSYQLRLATASEAGEGPWGLPVTFTTLPALPGTPRGEEGCGWGAGGRPEWLTCTALHYRLHRELRSLACCILMATVTRGAGGWQVSL